MLRLLLRICAVPCTLALTAYPVLADDVIVTVSGAQDIAGEVRSERSADGTACVFSNLVPGSYALVVATLPKGQDDVTRDLLGHPRQPWGVSNNIRHALRAPRFDEAIFTVERGKTTRLKIALAK